MIEGFAVNKIQTTIFLYYRSSLVLHVPVLRHFPHGTSMIQRKAGESTDGNI